MHPLTFPHNEAVGSEEGGDDGDGDDEDEEVDGRFHNTSSKAQFSANELKSEAHCSVSVQQNMVKSGLQCI